MVKILDEYQKLITFIICKFRSCEIVDMVKCNGESQLAMEMKIVNVQVENSVFDIC
jgi:hypothetical protein